MKILTSQAYAYNTDTLKLDAEFLPVNIASLAENGIRCWL